MRKVFISFLFFLSTLALNAQDIRAILEEDPYRAVNNMHSYEFFEIKDTPAPKGYKPFYINHYGRHGSRFEQNSTFARASIEGFRRLDSLKLLNEDGKKLFIEVKRVQDEHVGMEGSLTPRGAREHRQIADRMAHRYPQVFKNKNRNEVNAFSSTSQRCIISMTNFSYSLKENYPKLDFTFTSADKFMAYINPSLRVYAPGNEPKAPAVPPANMAQMRRPSAPSAPGYDFTRFLSQIVTDTDAAMKALGNPEPFVKGIFNAGGYSQLIDYLGVNILPEFFNTDELYYFWASGNDNIYRMWAASTETGDNVKWAARPLLQDFIDKADAAIKDDSHRAADLRFGHDTAILPMFALIGIDDLQGRRFSYKEAHANDWFSFWQIPMGTNCQMVYYKNKKGEVITKILYNEKEVTIPGLQSDIAPYYKWDDLKAYFEKKIAWQ